MCFFIVGRVLSVCGFIEEIGSYIVRVAEFFCLSRQTVSKFLPFTGAICTKIEIVFVYSTKNPVLSKIFLIVIDRQLVPLYNLYSKPGLANSFFCDIKGGYTMKMKKLIAGALAMAMALSLVACGGGDKPTTSQGNTPPPSTGSQNGSQTPSGGGNDLSANLTLATYPVGKMTDETVIKGLIADFNAVYPNVKIDVIYLDYANGDQTVNSMIEGKSAPDLIFEGPERLVANWGAKGLMVDLKDLLPAGTYDVTVGSCTNADGAVYELPVCQTAHCMGINKDLFTQAGAMQYINEDTHTWKSTADFLKAVEAVAAIPRWAWCSAAARAATRATAPSSPTCTAAVTPTTLSPAMRPTAPRT
jgi:hypothetical protein